MRRGPAAPSPSTIRAGPKPPRESATKGEPGTNPTSAGTPSNRCIGQQGSVFIRIAFNVADPSRLESVRLWMRYDDGFVAYLNGHEIARANAPEPLSWNSLATTAHDDWEAEMFQEFGISGGVELLKPGRNVLAIQGLNVPTTSTDFLIQPRLDAVQKAEPAEEPQFGADSQTWIELHNKGQDDDRSVRVASGERRQLRDPGRDDGGARWLSRNRQGSPITSRDYIPTFRSWEVSPAGSPIPARRSYWRTQRATS